jgi:hypothetical protein
VSPTPHRMTISLRAILAIYAVIPACVAVYLFDRFVLGGAIRGALPANPDKLFVFGLLFGWPHIVASNLIFVGNREYRRTFGRRALIASIAIVAFFAIGNVALPYIVLSLVAATATMIHVVKQQVGIGAGAARLKSWMYPTWGWIGIAVAVCVYNAIYLEDDLVAYERWLDIAAAALSGLVLVFAVILHVRIAPGLGRAFLWGNTAMMVAPTALHLGGYDIFALAIPRIIHDCTAFAFYVVHDHNKHGASAASPVFRLAAKLPGGMYWISPAIAVGFAFLLEHHGDGVFNAITGHAFTSSFPQAISLGLLGFLAMLHYYMEAITWKAGSPYRQHVAVRA